MANSTAADSKRKFVWIAFLLAIVGIPIAGYLLSEHFTGAEMLGCSKNGTFDCASVNTSIFSEIKGVPIALYGLFGYILMAWFSFRRLSRGKEADGSLAIVFCLSVVALVIDGFLLWAQVARIGHYCPWCMSTYVISLGILVSSTLALGSPARVPSALKMEWDELGSSKPVGYGLLAATLLVMLFVSCKAPPKGTGTWCLAGNLCTNAPGGISSGPNIAGVFGNPAEAKAREEILHAPFLDPGPGGGYARGPAHPVLTVVEFGDLECPACRRFSWTMDEFAQKHPNEVRWVFRHYPLDQLCNPNVHVKIHEYACATARAAEAAGLQGKFWDFVDDVYKQNDASGTFIQKPDLTDKGLEDRAKALGLNVDQWKKDTSADPVISKIVDDVQMGAQMGINSTPTLFVNGRMISGGASMDYLEVWLKMAKDGQLDPHGPSKAQANGG